MAMVVLKKEHDDNNTNIIITMILHLYSSVINKLTIQLLLN